MKKNNIFKIVKNNRNTFIIVLVLVLALITYIFFYSKNTLETMTTINIYTDEEYKVNHKSDPKSIAPPYEESKKTISEPEPAPQTKNEALFTPIQDKTEKTEKTVKTDSEPVTTKTEKAYTADEAKGKSTNDAIKEQSANYSTTFTKALS